MARQEQMRDQNLAVTLRTIVDAVRPSRAPRWQRRRVLRAGRSRGWSTSWSRAVSCASSSPRRRFARAVRRCRSSRSAGPSPASAWRSTSTTSACSCSTCRGRCWPSTWSSTTCAARTPPRCSDGSRSWRTRSSRPRRTCPSPAPCWRSRAWSTGSPDRCAPRLASGWRDVDVVALLGDGDGAVRAGWRTRPTSRPAPRRTRAGGGSFVYVSGEIGIGGAIVLDGQICSAAARLERRDRAHPGGRGARSRSRPARTPCCATPGSTRRRGWTCCSTRSPRETRGPAPSVAQAGRALGDALAAAVNVVDVGEVVLGGTFGELFDHVHEAVQEQLDTSVIFAPWAPLDGVAGPGRCPPAMTGAALAVLGDRARRSRRVAPSPSAVGSSPVSSLWIGTYPVAGAGTPVGLGEGIWRVDLVDGVLRDAASGRRDPVAVLPRAAPERPGAVRRERADGRHGQRVRRGR